LLLALHQHNQAAAARRIFALLDNGSSVALVSDAGTPLISDPGFRVVAEARARGFEVLCIPGPAALTAALSVAGFPADRFVFEGFLPSRAASRQRRLRDLSEERRTLVFYEAPHRLAAMLHDVARTFGGDRKLAVAREMTKKHETFYSDTAQSLARRAAEDPDFARGELVVISHGYDGVAVTREMNGECLLRAMLEELSPSQACRIAARLLPARKQDLYAQALKIQTQLQGGNDR